MSRCFLNFGPERVVSSIRGGSRGRLESGTGWQSAGKTVRLLSEGVHYSRSSIKLPLGDFDSGEVLGPGNLNLWFFRVSRVPHQNTLQIRGKPMHGGHNKHDFHPGQVTTSVVGRS